MDALSSMRFPAVVPGGVAGPAIQPFNPPKISRDANLSRMANYGCARGARAFVHRVGGYCNDIRALALRVAIPNPRHTLVPGMTAQVILPAAK